MTDAFSILSPISLSILLDRSVWREVLFSNDRVRAAECRLGIGIKASKIRETSGEEEHWFSRTSMHLRIEKSSWNALFQEPWSISLMERRRMEFSRFIIQHFRCIEEFMIIVGYLFSVFHDKSRIARRVWMRYTTCKSMNWIPIALERSPLERTAQLFYTFPCLYFDTLNISHRLDLDSQSEAIITASTAAIFSTESPRTKGCIFLCPRNCPCDFRSCWWRRSQYGGSTRSSGNSDTVVRTRQHRRNSSRSWQTSTTTDRARASGLSHFRSTSWQEDPATATSTHQIPSDDWTAESIVVATTFPCPDDRPVVVIVIIVLGREFNTAVIVVLGGITAVWLLYAATAARRIVVVSQKIQFYVVLERDNLQFPNVVLTNSFRMRINRRFFFVSESLEIMRAISMCLSTFEALSESITILRIYCVSW